jgi:RNA polymerase sigma factor (sigma-70 family)
MSKKIDDIQILAEKYIEDRSSENFGNLYKRIKYGLRSHILKVVKDLDYVDDVESIVLEKVWKNIDMYNANIAKFSTWLYRIAFYDAVQYMNAKTKDAKYILPEDISNLYSVTIAGENNANTDAFTMSDNVDYVISDDNEFITITKDDLTVDLYDASLECIYKLPENYKLIITEKIVNEKTIAQIAHEQQIPVTTVKNWLFKGRLYLRELIKSEYGELYNSYMEFDII